MATTVTVYPREGKQYPDAAGVPITSAGAIVDVSKYILDALKRGDLLDWDPLDIREPDDRTGIPAGNGEGAPTYASAALLAEYVGVSDGASAFTNGHSSSGDGGGGEWYWDASDNTTVSDNALCCGVGTGRWKRRYNGPICARWFGATGDGSTDDYAALQAWINAIPQGGEGYLDPGDYYIHSPLICTTDDVTIRGPGGRNTTIGARIVWAGSSSTVFALTFSKMGQTLHGIHFSLTTSCRGFVEVGSIGGSLCSNFRLTDCFMRGGDAVGGPTFDFGVAIGYTNPSANNMEYMTFEDVVVANMERSGFYVGGNPNALGHVWKRCAVTNFLGGPGSRQYVLAGMSDGLTHQYGIGIELVGGNQVTIEDCRWGNLEVWVTFEDSQDREYVHIIRSDSEYSKKAVYGNFANYGHIVIDSCRDMLQSLDIESIGPIGFTAADRVHYEITGGPYTTLELRSCSIIKSDGFASTQSGTIHAPQIFATGCVFSSITPWASGATVPRVYSWGNRGSTGAGQAARVLDGVYQPFGYENIPIHFDALQTFSPEYRLIAGSAGSQPSAITPRKNAIGKVTISGATASAAVNFSASEVDTTYIVTIAPVETTGTPASGAYTAMALSKTVNGFTLTPVAAPGVGSSVTYVWEIVSGYGV